jgi:hypothetical protein
LNNRFLTNVPFGKVSGWDSTPGDVWDGVFMSQQIRCQAPCCKPGAVAATTGAARAGAEPGIGG